VHVLLLQNEDNSSSIDSQLDCHGLTSLLQTIPDPPVLIRPDVISTSASATLVAESHAIEHNPLEGTDSLGVEFRSKPEENVELRSKLEENASDDGNLILHSKSINPSHFIYKHI